jgi:hypothetical protein
LQSAGKGRELRSQDFGQRPRDVDAQRFIDQAERFSALTAGAFHFGRHALIQARREPFHALHLVKKVAGIEAEASGHGADVKSGQFGNLFCCSFLSLI